ncbi:MAG: hypothetical protein U0R71_00820 [Solirubrobacterales bacterium]
MSAGRPVFGFQLLLAPLDDGPQAARILEALGERYEVSRDAADPLLTLVQVDDAWDPAQAVVRLASVLDEIDSAWQTRIAWPRVAQSAEARRNIT